MGIVASRNIEERRQQEQTRLDSLKTASQRNKWGQFATPSELALSLARYAHSLLGKTPARFLDPAIGTGSFFSAALQAFGTEHISAATGIELDPLFADTAKTLWGGWGLHIIEGDFTKQRPPAEHFNLVLTNPPYVRHHHLAAEEKDRLKAQLARSLQLDISGLAGLYCYFLLLCHDWMQEQGLAVWLIPSEFMDVNYGVTLRRYLTERVTLLHIHRFCPTDVSLQTHWFPLPWWYSGRRLPHRTTPPTSHSQDRLSARRSKRKCHSARCANPENGHSSQPPLRSVIPTRRPWVTCLPSSAALPRVPTTFSS